MNTSQGYALVEGIGFFREDSTQQMLPTNFPGHIKSDQKNKVPHKSILAKMVFFSCEKCCGPLIPVSDCKVCQKTSFRRCVKCGWKITSGNHDSCECLIEFTKMKTEKEEISK